MTFSSRGPFRRSDTKRQQQMAVATPPEFIRAKISGELAEAAARYGVSELEAAAFASLGLPLV
jgi:hypothetical protein